MFFPASRVIGNIDYFHYFTSYIIIIKKADVHSAHLISILLYKIRE